MMQLVCCILYASLLWRTTAKQADVELATTKEMKAFFTIFANSTAPYPAASYSTAAFQKTYDLFKKGQSSADGVWPYILTVRDDKLTSSIHTDYLLKKLFKKIPAHRVLDKAHLLVYLSHDQRPLQSDVDRLSKIERVLPSKPLHVLPIGTRIGVDLFEQITNPPVKQNPNVQLLVTLRDSGTYKAFKAKTESDLSSASGLWSMKAFEQDLSKADDLFKAAFSNTAPDQRFGSVSLFYKSGNRVAVNVALKRKDLVAADKFYLSFYFARNLEHVVFVDARPVEFPLAAEAAGFTQRGSYTLGVCDPMYHHGLLGQGEIVGLVDTGIDLTSSFLYSPTGPFCVSHANKKEDFCGGVATLPQSKAASRKLDGEDFYYNKDGRVVVRYDAADKADTEEGAKSGHGTFLAGVIAGAPNPSKAFGQCADSKHQEARGAGRSKIAFYDVGAGKNHALTTPAYDYNAMFRPAFAIGARVFTVAFGSGDFNDAASINGLKTPRGKGKYTAAASDIDAFMYNNKEALVVVAAGNSGPGFVTSPAISKNALTVGSVSASGTTVSPFSAGGNQPDGRMKPDLIAIGDSMISASSKVTKGETLDRKQLSHCDITQKSGTSVSAALVTAAATQVRQYFKEGYYPSGEASEKEDGAQFVDDLWGSTVKAILIAGSQPLTDVQSGGKLGTSEGYGSLILNNVLPFKDDNQLDLVVTQDKISAGQPYERTIEIESDDKPLVVTLAWTGPESVVGARSPIVNQLELAVHEETFQRDWSTEIDTEQTGNVKRFYILEPTPGKYRISIQPSFVRDEQEFSLVITGRFADKERSSPLCCSGTAFPGVGSCITLDMILCVVFVAVLLLFLIVGAIVMAVRRGNAAKEEEEEKKEADKRIHPL